MFKEKKRKSEGRQRLEKQLHWSRVEIWGQGGSWGEGEAEDWEESGAYIYDLCTTKK